jgi:hypothetical protein
LLLIHVQLQMFTLSFIAAATAMVVTEALEVAMGDMVADMEDMEVVMEDMAAKEDMEAAMGDMEDMEDITED